MIDIHVHFGQFDNIYFNPDQIIDNLIKIGIKRIGLMPTIRKNGDNILEAHNNMKRIVDKYGNYIIPIMWVHYSTKEKDMNMMLKDLPYKILKVHGYIHDWYKHPNELKKVIDISRKNNLLVMFHTGGRKESYAFKYKKICKDNPDIFFILAHSRPIKGTINIMKEFPNVYCDISFTPIKHILLLKEHHLVERVLWGTDSPIYLAFDPSIDLIQWYKKRCDELLGSVGEFDYNLITKRNFSRILI